MSKAQERLLELTQERGSSLARLSEMIGRNPTYLQQFIRKGSPRKLEEHDRKMLADFFRVPESELGGSAKASEDKSYNARTALPLEAGWVDVPRLAISASAGQGAVVGAEAAFDNFRFSRKWLREQGLEGAQLSAILVEGDSMEPLLRAGDEVLVDLRPLPFRDGIYVVRLEDTLLVKRVAAQGGGRLSLLSQNLAYPPLNVSVDAVEIIGRVVWKSGKL
ncbi:S24 family peptidase [Pontixanthobacter sp.]|uniref:S24 family peptidase n=1 Tax=Pontixanthobacter sp. TaxID=2792078 RepID=UPI003C7DB3F1